MPPRLNGNVPRPEHLQVTFSDALAARMSHVTEEQDGEQQQ